MKQRERRLPFGWYPSDEAGCRRDIERFLAEPPQTTPNGPVRHGIVPHAGWYFSGRAAAHVYAAAAKAAPQPEVVVIYGGHLGGDENPIIYDYDGWETPFGLLPIHRELTEKIGQLVEVTPEGPRPDNTVEVQIPMVPYFFPDAQLVAVHAPNSAAAIELGRQVAEAAKQTGIPIAVFGAADLTHYGRAYGFAPQGNGPQAVKWVKEENDREIIDRTLQMDAAGAIASADQRHNCCSSGAVAATIATAQVYRANQAVLLDYYTSYDVDPGDNIVGYMGVGFCDG